MIWFLIRCIRSHWERGESHNGKTFSKEVKVIKLYEETPKTHPASPTREASRVRKEDHRLTLDSLNLPGLRQRPTRSEPAPQLSTNDPSSFPIYRTGRQLHIPNYLLSPSSIKHRTPSVYRAIGWRPRWLSEPEKPPETRRTDPLPTSNKWLSSLKGREQKIDTEGGVPLSSHSLRRMSQWS